MKNLKVFFLVMVLFFGCSKQMSENRLADTNFNKSQAIENKSLEKSESFNEAPTLAPLMQAYYDALKRRDEQALRKTLSSDTIKSLEEDMKAEKKKSLVDFILELETLPDKPYEIRNEKIDGESAIAEIKGGSYQVWTKFYFVKEAGEWKITNKSPDFEK